LELDNLDDLERMETAIEALDLAVLEDPDTVLRRLSGRLRLIKRHLNLPEG
jgi:hypothetical protein